MPEVDGKKYAYTEAGKAAAKVAAASKAAARKAAFSAGKGIGASGVARSGLKEAARRGSMYKQGADKYRQGADRKTLKKAGNRDAVTKRTMPGY